MSQFMPDNLTNVLGRAIDGEINLYEQMLDDGHEPNDAEVNDLHYLYDRIGGLIDRIGGNEPTPSAHTPRWPTKG
jgi:hypothetical protein